MYRKKEVCRNFVRGSCTYGERCKFLHVSNTQHQQQQPRQQQQSSPFGFGHPQQQQQQHLKQQNQFKPFENKWTRAPDAKSPLFQQSNNQSNAATTANHECTNPESCKCQIEEDFRLERPLWRLTCYGHSKYLPCDIVGDISYEELRAAAYDDAKKGFSLLSVVERERNIINSKLNEFENLLRNPYAVSPNTVSAGPSPFPGNTNNNAQPITVQKNVPPPVSSFSQLGIATNQGSNTSALAAPNNSFGQSSPFQISSQTSGTFGVNSLTFGTQGLFGGQNHMQPQPSTFNHPMSSGNNLTASLAASLQSTGAASNQSSIFSMGRNASMSSVGQTPMSNSTEGVSSDTSIWLKEKWNPGEIPEEAPPDEFV